MVCAEGLLVAHFPFSLHTSLLFARPVNVSEVDGNYTSAFSAYGSYSRAHLREPRPVLGMHAFDAFRCSCCGFLINLQSIISICKFSLLNCTKL